MTPPLDATATASAAPDALGGLLESRIREELKKQLDAERQIITNAIGLAIKIVVAAFAVFLAIFTIFGLTTWKDIKAETAAIVGKEATALLEKADTGTGVKEQLNDLLNRTLVSSVLARRMRTTESNVELQHNDWERLRAWIQREALPLTDFKDALTVLSLQSDERKKADASLFLSDMLNPPEKSSFHWIRKQPDKLEAILSIFKHKDLGSTALDLVEVRNIHGPICLAAIDYVREVGFSDGVDRLLLATDALTNSRMKRKALSAAVRLRPDHPVALQRIKALLDDPDRETVEMALDILKFAYSPDEGVRLETEELQQLKAMGGKLFAVAAAKGLTLRTANYDAKTRFPAVTGEDSPSSSGAVETQVQFWIPTSKTVNRGAFRMTLEQFEEFEPYWAFLTERLNAGDSAAALKLLPRSANAFGLLRMRMLGTAGVASAHSIDIEASDGKMEVVEKGADRKVVHFSTAKDIRIPLLALGRPMVLWKDAAGEQRLATLVSLSGKNFKLALNASETRQ